MRSSDSVNSLDLFLSPSKHHVSIFSVSLRKMKEILIKLMYLVLETENSGSLNFITICVITE